MADAKICSVDGCGNPQHARGFCGKHYLRLKKHGDPNGGVHRTGADCSGQCSVAGCGKPGNLGGMCQPHWRGFRKYGDPLLDGRALKTGPCSIDGCEARARGHGLCGKHYMRKRRHGDPVALGKNPNGTLGKWLLDHINYNEPECLIWPFSRSSTGYYDGEGYAGNAILDGQRDSAYRHMCRLVHGEPPTDIHQAAHSCGKGHFGCVHPKHLRWALPVENMLERNDHGTMLRGEQIANAILTEDDVRKIRSMHGKATYREIGKLFGVSEGGISSIMRRKSWRHVAD